MTILFDLLCSQPDKRGTKFHGGGEYAKTVFGQLIKQKTDQEVIVFYDYERFLDTWLNDLIRDYNIKSIDIKKYYELSTIFDKFKIDTYYSALLNNDISNIVPDNVHRICTIHGLREIERPTDKYEFLFQKSFKTKFKALIKYCTQDKLVIKYIRNYKAKMSGYDEIVCVSHHTECAIANIFSDLKLNVPVFYTPAKYISENFDHTPPTVDGKYILLIGCNRWEKNCYRAILAINDLIARGILKDYKVVTVGTLPSNIKNTIKGKSYQCFDYVETNLLENLYYYSDFFIYPSLNEGFGMPPLEAMKYGKTCIVSGVCSIPEVCGDAVYYFNPYDIKEIQNRIIMAMNHKIPVSKVLDRVKTIKEKQDSDLVGLCNLLLNSK